MARNQNTWLGTGRLGQDPEVRSTQSGEAIASFRLASTNTRRSREGEKVDDTFWASVVLFGHSADFARDYLKKGDLVRVSGPLATRKWQDREGKDRYVTEVVINNFRGELELLTSKARDGDEGQNNRPAPQRRNGQQSRQSNEWDGYAPAGGGDLDTDIPF